VVYLFSRWNSSAYGSCVCFSSSIQVGAGNLHIPMALSMTKSFLKSHLLTWLHGTMIGQRDMLQMTKDIALGQLLSAAHLDMINLEQTPEPIGINRGDTSTIEKGILSIFSLRLILVFATISHGSDVLMCFTLQNCLWHLYNKLLTYRTTTR
jgi:hypothetical protein